MQVSKGHADACALTHRFLKSILLLLESGEEEGCVAADRPSVTQGAAATGLTTAEVGGTGGSIAPFHTTVSYLDMYDD